MSSVVLHPSVLALRCRLKPMRGSYHVPSAADWSGFFLPQSSSTPPPASPPAARRTDDGNKGATQSVERLQRWSQIRPLFMRLCRFFSSGLMWPCVALTVCLSLSGGCSTDTLSTMHNPSVCLGAPSPASSSSSSTTQEESRSWNTPFTPFYPSDLPLWIFNGAFVCLQNAFNDMHCV